MKIWQKYFLKEICKFILFFLLCIFTLFSIIDFFTHSTRLFTYGSIKWHTIIFYYLNQFVLRFYLFLPLAFLFALIKVLVDMNQHNELSPLLMAGLSRNILFKPFFYVAAFLCFFSFGNFELFTPHAVAYIENFKDHHLKKKIKDAHIHPISLQDDSTLIFQTALSKSKYFDVFWIKDSKNIWHAKYLDISQNRPKGTLVDHFFYNEESLVTKKESFDEYIFPDMKVSSINLEKKSIDAYSLSELFVSAFDKTISQKDISKVRTQLNYKLSMPLLPFIIVFFCGPYCMRFSKNFSIFFLVSISLLCFFAFYTLMDSVVILCENQVFSSLFSIWSIFLILIASSKKIASST